MNFFLERLRLSAFKHFFFSLQLEQIQPMVSVLQNTVWQDQYIDIY